MRMLKEQIIDNNDLAGHIVLHGLSQHEDILNTSVEFGYCDVVLTINGKEIDLMSFVKHWESQVDSMIKQEAQDLVAAQVSELHSLADAVRQEMINRKLMPADWD